MARNKFVANQLIGLIRAVLLIHPSSYKYSTINCHYSLFSPNALLEGRKSPFSVTDTVDSSFFLYLKLPYILFHCLVKTVLEIWTVSKREEDLEPDEERREEQGLN